MDNKRTSVIIADAEYIDSVAFNLIVNFERMIVPPHSTGGYGAMG